MYKFGIGDKVKVVNYGCKAWKNENGNVTIMDMIPEIVGSIGLISQVSDRQGKPIYAIEGIPRMYAWYEQEQLEMINKNPNND